MQRCYKKRGQTSNPRMHSPWMSSSSKGRCERHHMVVSCPLRLPFPWRDLTVPLLFKTEASDNFAMHHPLIQRLNAELQLKSLLTYLVAVIWWEDHEQRLTAYKAAPSKTRHGPQQTRLGFLIAIAIFWKKIVLGTPKKASLLQPGKLELKGQTSSGAEKLFWYIFSSQYAVHPSE